MISTDDLPAPRIELAWKAKDMGEGYNWLCEYFLVLRLDQYDIRVRKRAKRPRELRLKVTRGTRVSAESPPDRYGRVTTPFRDGAHAHWDSEQLGKLPIYATYNGKASLIEPTPSEVS